MVLTPPLLLPDGVSAACGTSFKATPDLPSEPQPRHAQLNLAVPRRVCRAQPNPVCPAMPRSPSSKVRVVGALSLDYAMSLPMRSHCVWATLSGPLRLGYAGTAAGALPLDSPPHRHAQPLFTPRESVSRTLLPAWWCQWQKVLPRGCRVPVSHDSGSRLYVSSARPTSVPPGPGIEGRIAYPPRPRLFFGI